MARAHVLAYTTQAKSLEAIKAQDGVLELDAQEFSSFTAKLGKVAAAAAQNDLESRWAKSPYKAVRSSWNQSKNARIGVPMVKAILEQSGVKVELAKSLTGSSSHDFVSPRLGRISSKLSTEGVNGHFWWSGLDVTQSDSFFLLGVSPESISGWLIPGDKLNRLFGLRHTGRGIKGMSQHSDGYSIKISASKVPAWLKPFGGTDEQLAERIRINAGLAKK